MGEQLLDREHELAMIAGRVDALVERREGGVALLEGLAGMGKSELLAAAVELAEQRGSRVLSARGTELEFELAFGGVRQLFAAAVLALSPGERARVLAGPAGLARAALGLEEAPPPDRVGDPLYGLFWLAVNLAEGAPLVVAVDDLHWLDEESGRFVAYLARRIEGLPLLVFAAARPDEPGARQTPAAVLAEVGTVVRPGPLGEPAVARVLAATWGESPSARVVADCHRATGGNPFLVGELARSLADREGAAALAAAAPAAVARSVLDRVARVSAHAVALANAAALFPAGAGLSDAAAVAELELATAASAADGLVAAGVFAAGDRLVFLHPVMRAAVYEHLGEFGRRHGHARAADVLIARGLPAEDVAAHLLAGEPRGAPEAVVVLRHAAAAAARSGALRAASRYLERALLETPALGERWTLRRELGRFQAMTGAPEAEATLRAALAEAATPVERVDTAVDLAAVLYGHVDSDAAVDVLLEVQAEAVELDRERRLLVDAVLAAAAWDSSRYPHLYIEVADALPAHLPGSTPGERLALSHVAARMFDRCEPHEGVLAVLRRAVGDEPAPLVVTGVDLGDPLGLMIGCGGLDDAEAVGRRRQEQARAAGRDGVYVASQVALARIAWYRGELREAEATLRLGLELPGGLVGDRLMLTCHLALLLCTQGRVDEAEQVLAGTEEESSESISGAMLARARAELALARRQAEAALPPLERAFDVHRRRGSANPAEMLWLRSLCEALAAVGRTDEALAAMEDFLARAARFGEPRPFGIAHLTLGRLSRSSERLQHFEQAVAVLEPSPYRLELAEAQLELGAALRRANRRRDSRSYLRAALDYARRNDVRAVAARAEEELRATGARPRRLVLTGVGALTPSEARIARLAADSMSNREIAQQLFLTVKTVEMHLGASYRKLGIASRRELPSALTAERSPITRQPANGVASRRTASVPNR